MTLTYEQIEPFIDAGATTAAEVLTAMQADRRTVQPIQISELLHVLNLRGMLRKLTRTDDNGEKWSGTVHAMLKAAESSGVPEMADAAQLWFSHVTNPRNTLFDTTDAAFAAAFAAMVATYQDQPGMPRMPTADDFAAVYALGGGWRWADVTEGQIAAVMVAENRREWAAAVRAKAGQAAEAAETESRKSDSTQASIEAAADAVWGA